MSLSPTVELNLAPLAQREDDDSPEKPVCANCRGYNITFEATAYWDAETQRFEYNIVKGEVFCLDCAEDHRPDWVPL